MTVSVWIGFDRRETAAYAVARHSLRQYALRYWPVRGIVLSSLVQEGIYTRPIEMRASAADRPIMWDVISDAPMSTEHAVARFMIGELARQYGLTWAMFCDGDVLFRDNIGPLVESLDKRYALYCVKHDYRPNEGIKMDGMVQTVYPRKNWSSVFFLNVAHPSNRKLTRDLVNSVPGRELHRFCWLHDDEIGELDPRWNYLVGQSSPVDNPGIVHFTLGTPDMVGYDSCEYSDEWRRVYLEWAK